MNKSVRGRHGVVAVITARAGSKRLPGKNVRDFMGQPLVVWSARAALASPVVDRTVVSTDDPAVVAALEGLPVEIIDRPAHLAGDQATSRDVIRHADALLGGSDGGPGLLVLLQPTSPLREADLIGRAVEAIAARPEADQLIELTSQVIGSGKIIDGWWQPNYPETVRSQDLAPVWYPSGRLFVYRCAPTFDFVGRDPERVLALTAPLEKCTNIDHEADFHWAEVVYRRFVKEFEYLRG